jgi:hypothetical protein
VVISSVVNTGNDARVGARALGVEDLDTKQGSLLGDTIGLRANSASTMSTMAVTIRVFAIFSKVFKEGSACDELSIRLQ